MVTDFYKIHAHLIAGAKASQKFFPGDHFRIAALGPCMPPDLSASVKDEETWLIDFIMDINAPGGFRASKEGQAGIDTWTAKYGNEPDWRWEIPKW